MIIFATPAIIALSVSPYRAHALTGTAIKDDSRVLTRFPWPLFVLGMRIVTVRVTVTCRERFLSSTLRSSASLSFLSSGLSVSRSCSHYSHSASADRIAHKDPRERQENSYSLTSEPYERVLGMLTNFVFLPFPSVAFFLSCCSKPIYVFIKYHTGRLDFLSPSLRCPSRLLNIRWSTRVVVIHNRRGEHNRGR